MSLKPLTSVIIEDEEESLLLLKSLIESNSLVELDGTTGDPSEAVDLILNLNPDIVFLDIKMPGKNGFDILDELRVKGTIYPFIVFVTAYDEYAVKAFEYAAFDYILKPVDPHRLGHTIQRCNKIRLSERAWQTDILPCSYGKLFFRNTSGVVFVDPADVVYVKAEGNYSVFSFCNTKSETVSVNLGKIADQLDPGTFIRISRSFIINTCYLKKINTKQQHCYLTVNSHEYKCDISRDKISELIKVMRNR
jgi:DNA-binding LytR/AlgR family response regulator